MPPEPPVEIPLPIQSHEALVPSEEWVEENTPSVVQGKDPICPSCFAIVKDAEGHRAWHENLITNILASTRR